MNSILKLTFLILLFNTCVFAQKKVYGIKHAVTNFIIDGLISDWDSIPFSSNFVNHENGDTIGSDINFKLSWDSLNLYGVIKVEDTFIDTNQTLHDSYIFKTDDCTELFIDFDGNGKNYLELGINPNGVYFDYHIISTKKSIYQFQSNSNWNIKGLEIKTSIKKDYYIIEFKIPFEDLATLPNGNFTQPKDQTIWKGNLFNINPTNKSYNAWSPCYSYGFHQPTKFGILQFLK